MKLQSKIKFADENVKQAFFRLEHGTTDEQKLFNKLSHIFKELTENAFYGTQIQKNKIPKEYLAHGIDNCWKVNLPNGWRLIYAVERDELVVLAIILEWFNHKEYERKFGY